MLEISIHRHRISKVACDGTLSINGDHVCDTAEHSQYKVPAGTYRIALCKSKTYGRKVPILVGAPGICIFHGNSIYGKRDGRILVGLYIIPGWLKHSNILFMLLYDRINKAIRRGHEVTLRITEN